MQPLALPVPLPPGLTARPLTPADSGAAYDVIAAGERHDVGEVVIEEADLVADWSRPSHDLASRSLAVLDGDRIVACAELSGPDRAEVAVHPDVRGRGIGTAVAAWVRATARALGSDVVGQPVPEGSPGDRLLAGLGYRVRWTSWVLRLPEGSSVPDRPLPEGYVVREAREEDRRGAWQVVEDAFLEWSTRDRQAYDDFAATVWGRPGFEPWHLRVVLDPDGEVAAVASLHVLDDFAYVDKLATRADQRHRGLTQALLADSFRVARDHGHPRAELSTDFRTGALDLYLKVGMEPVSVWVNRAADLTGPHLPEGYTSRPLTLDDAAAVHAVIAAEEVADLGEAELTLEDVVADWQRPSYDVSASTVGVLAGDELVAYADLSAPEVAYTAVHPDHQGRGIGTALARWVQARARAAGAARVGTQVPEGSAADRLMADLGYDVLWTAWDLELPEGAELAARPLPDGYELRDATEADREAAWTLLEDAFLEWADRDRVPLEDFGARVWGRPGAEPWNLRLLWHTGPGSGAGAGGELVGATHVHLAGEAGDAAYVAKLAVRPDHRGRGLAPAMLVDAFGLAREHGAVRCYLSTDTRAGARGLYEKVGMVVSSTWVNRSVTL